MTIRHSSPEDLPRILEILHDGRLRQIESGNPNQWPEGYPSEEKMKEEIAEGVSYVMERDGEIVGAFSFIIGIDPTYLEIEGGRWIEDTLPYGTIHRIAGVRTEKGIASECFGWCWEQIKNLRADTHEDNAAMKHCLEKAGFRYCGIIHIASGAERVAYQKI